MKRYSVYGNAGGQKIGGSRANERLGSMSQIYVVIRVHARFDFTQNVVPSAPFLLPLT